MDTAHRFHFPITVGVISGLLTVIAWPATSMAWSLGATKVESEGIAQLTAVRTILGGNVAIAPQIFPECGSEQRVTVVPHPEFKNGVPNLSPTVLRIIVSSHGKAEQVAGFDQSERCDNTKRNEIIIPVTLEDEEIVKVRFIGNASINVRARHSEYKLAGGFSHVRDSCTQEENLVDCLVSEDLRRTGIFNSAGVAKETFNDVRDDIEDQKTTGFKLAFNTEDSVGNQATFRTGPEDRPDQKAIDYTMGPFSKNELAYIKVFTELRNVALAQATIFSDAAIVTDATFVVCVALEQVGVTISDEEKADLQRVCSAPA